MGILKDKSYQNSSKWKIKHKIIKPKAFFKKKISKFDETSFDDQEKRWEARINNNMNENGGTILYPTGFKRIIWGYYPQLYER